MSPAGGCPPPQCPTSCSPSPPSTSLCLVRVYEPRDRNPFCSGHATPSVATAAVTRHLIFHKPALVHTSHWSCLRETKEKYQAKTTSREPRWENKTQIPPPPPSPGVRTDSGKLSHPADIHPPTAAGWMAAVGSTWEQGLALLWVRRRGVHGVKQGLLQEAAMPCDGDSSVFQLCSSALRSRSNLHRQTPLLVRESTEKLSRGKANAYSKQ